MPEDDDVVELILTSPASNAVVLQRVVRRFCELMADVVEEPGAYPGLPRDVILSLLAYSFHCKPDELPDRLRALVQAMECGAYRETAAPRPVKPS